MRARVRLVGIGLTTLALACAGGKGRDGGGSSTPVTDGEEPVERGGEPKAGDDDEITSLCAHGYELTIAARGIGSPAVREDFMQSCRRNNEARQAADPQGWATRRSCVLAATDTVGLGVCEGRPVVEAGPEARDEDLATQVCSHVFTILEQDPDIASLLLGEQRESMIEQCMTSVRDSYAKDPEKFRREAACVLRTTDIAGLEDCDED